MQEEEVSWLKDEDKNTLFTLSCQTRFPPQLYIILDRAKWSHIRHRRRWNNNVGIIFIIFMLIQEGMMQKLRITPACFPLLLLWKITSCSSASVLKQRYTNHCHYCARRCSPLEKISVWCIWYQCKYFPDTLTFDQDGDHSINP